jgi:hypothetical protein
MSDAPRTAAQRRRWAVHLWLIITFLAALPTAAHFLGHVSIGWHSLIGLAFAGLIVVHFIQRRHRVRSLLSQLRRSTSWRRSIGRLAWSDLILSFLFANLIASGIVDYLRHANGVFVNLGFMRPIRWHALSALLLLVYLLVHVIRRAARLRTSRVS